MTLFQTPTFVSLFSGNPMLPALGLLFGGLLAVGRWCETRDRRWALAALLLLGGLTQFKLFAGVHTAAALGLAAIVMWLTCRDSSLLAVAIPAGLWAAGSLVMSKVGNQALPQDFAVAPLWPRWTLQNRPFVDGSNPAISRAGSVRD